MKYTLEEKREKRKFTTRIETAWSGPDTHEHEEEVLIRTYHCELTEKEFKRCIAILSLNDKQFNKIKKKYKIGDLDLR